MDIMLQRIIELLGEKHGATKELANAIGVLPNTISNWKSGTNRSYTKYVSDIAEYYGVSVDYLCGKTDEKSAKKEATLSDGFRSNLVDDIMSLSEADAALVAAYVAGLKSKH